MIVCQEHEFQFRSFGIHELVVGFNIKDRVDEDTLLLRLEIVGEDGKLRSFELPNVETLS